MRQPTEHVAKNGKRTWKVRFRHDDQQTSETFTDYAEAWEFARDLKAMGSTKALARRYAAIDAVRVPRLDEVAADHIRYLTGVEDGTRLNYTRLWDRTWGPLIGDTPANAVTRDRIADATNDLARRYSSKSLKNQRGLLAAVCDRAVDQGHMKVNPTKRLRLPRGLEQERVEMRILTPDELERIVAECHPHYRPLVQFLASTGCRWGEAVALTVADVDPAKSTVRVRRALKWSPDNKRTVGATKTTRSNRAVPLAEGMADVMRGLVEGRGRNDLVFTAPRGGPVQHRTFWSDVWLPAVTAAKVGEPRPRIHDMRHSYAGRLLGAGVPIHVVQRLLGHESIKTTVDTYGGLLPDALTQAANAAALTFTGVSRIEA